MEQAQYSDEKECLDYCRDGGSLFVANVLEENYVDMESLVLGDVVLR
jgi:hypothetical protein